MVSPVYHFDIEQGTDEWLALRRGVITASTIGKLITATGKPANNDTSRAQMLQLLAERILGDTEDSFYGEDMQRGHLLEQFARDLYAKHYAPVQECGFVTADFDGVTIGYSPDGLVGDDGLIEVKSPRRKNHLKSLLNDEVPAEYMAQVQTALLVTGRDWCDYISYAPGLPLYVKRCEWANLMAQQLIEAAHVAEAQLKLLHLSYLEAAGRFPATNPIQPEQEIVI